MDTVVSTQIIVKKNRLRILLHWNSYAKECSICFESKGPFNIFHKTCVICNVCKKKLKLDSRCFQCRKPLNHFEMKSIYGYLYTAKPAEQIKSCPNCGVRIVKDGGCNHIKCTMCSHEFDWDTLDPVMYDEVLAWQVI